MPAILCKLFRNLGFSSLSLRRLEANIKDFEISFHRYKLIAEQEGKDRSWIDGCNTHLMNANKSWENCDVDSGYQSLLNAEREAIPGMPEAELHARVISLKNEIEKKLEGSWRYKAVSTLLNEQPGPVHAESIKEALFHRNTYSQNIYRKIELLRNQLLFNGALLVVLLIIAIAFALRDGLSILGQPLSGGLLPYAIYMGILGGTLSAAYSVTKTDSNAKIPDVQRTRMITLARSAIGGAAAIPVFILIQGNLVKFMDTPFTPWAVLFFCFLAGFSERWFLGTLDTFTKDKNTGEKAK